MIGRSSNLLGLAFTADRTIACAEIAVVAGRASLQHAATFVFPEGTTLEAPGPIGQALAAFLRQHKFGASRAVVGVPARWLVAVEKELPPADEETARSLLRLQAERLAVAESDSMIFDFAGEPQRNSITKVLLVGMHRKRLAEVQKLLDAAGMSVLAVTPSSLALAVGTGDDGGVLALARHGSEVVWRQNGSPRMLRHVPMTANGHDTTIATATTSELRRIVALSGSNGSTKRTLSLIDGLGVSDQQILDLSGRLGIAIQPKNSRELLGIDVSVASTEVLPAVAVALAAAREKLPLDFGNSRLTVGAPKRFGRRAVWGTAIGALVVLVIATMLILTSRRQSELADLKAKLNNPDLVAAKAAIDRLNFGRGYFADGRLAAIDCLREVTLAFRPDERIWATSFTIRDNGKCTLSGKASDQKTILRLLDGLKQTGKFTDVKLMDMREADNRGNEMTFSLGFTYNGPA